MSLKQLWRHGISAAGEMRRSKWLFLVFLAFCQVSPAPWFIDLFIFGWLLAKGRLPERLSRLLKR